MRHLQIAYAWEVPIGGFVWVPFSPRPNERNEIRVEHYLQRRNASPGFRRRTSSIGRKILEDFVRTEWTDQNKIALFADKYGPLGGHVSKTHDPTVTSAPPRDRLEFLLDWQAEMRFAREIVQLWKATFQPARNGTGEIAQANDASEVRRQSVLDRINDRLRQERVGLRLVHNATFEFCVAPRNLIGFIWAELALAVSTGVYVRNCEGCLRIFFPKRRDAVHCSGRCRTTEYRRKTGKK